VKSAAERVWECVGRVDKTTLQNILMRMPDKVCAVALATLAPAKQEALYTLIAAPKAARIREEIRLEARRRTSALVHGRIIRTFLSYFGEGGRATGRIWIRPRRP
jgi:hypothetical protein